MSTLEGMKALGHYYLFYSPLVKLMFAPGSTHATA
jgi:hypothetical protein